MGRPPRNLFPPISPAELGAVWADSNWATKFPPILSVEQAAELMQVPKATIYDWSSRGLLRGCSRKVGKHLRFFRDRFVRFVFEGGLQEDEGS